MFQNNSSQKHSREFNEEEWIAQVSQHINNDDDEEADISKHHHVCIFKIPKLFLSEPSSELLYFPQQVSIGPYHYLRDELYGMEKFKLHIAKETRKKLSSSSTSSTFEHLVDQLAKSEMRIRACYNNFLDFKSQTLVWMMAIDACFMVEIMDSINEHAQKGGEISRLLDYRGSYKLPYAIILQDFAMLENQIPLFVILKVFELRQPLRRTEERLVSMVLKICKELSPFGLKENYISTLSEFHLLDFLYQVIIHDVDGNCERLQISEDDEPVQVLKNEEGIDQHTNGSCNGKVISMVHEFFKAFIKKLMVFGLIKFLTNLSWKVVSTLPPFSLFKQPIESYLYAAENEGTNQPDNNENSNVQKSLLVEEIEIPSVSDLVASGINISHTNGGLSTISFDSKARTLYLPKVHMKTHTEVVLKNLISYETLVVLGPMILTRYAELMNGIIDTDEDVRLLKEKNIVISYLKNDGEVTDIWNGMRKSIKSTKVPFLDKVIDDINKYYDSRWQVKVKRFINIYLFDPWKFFICFAIFIFFLLMMIQTIFSFYRFMRF